MVSALRPRIGEKYVECSHGLILEQIIQDIGYLQSQKADVAQSGPVRPFLDFHEAGCLSVNAKEAGVRVCGRLCKKETTFSAADIYFQWDCPVEETLG